METPRNLVRLPLRKFCEQGAVMFRAISDRIHKRTHAKGATSRQQAK